MPTARLDRDILHRLGNVRDRLADSLEAPPSLADAARQAYLSPFHFHRLFVRAYGQTPHEFLTARRIDEAKRLLAQSNLSVTEICFNLGYQSLGSFSEKFRRVVGCTPTDYRIGTARFDAFSRVRTHRFVPTCFLIRGREMKEQERRSEVVASSNIVGEQ
jgi:AraC-like DNA-binding protein